MPMATDFYHITCYVYGGILVIAVLLYVYKIHFWKYCRRKQRVFPSAPQDKRYAVLIPARDESKVIQGLLDSIQRQTYAQELLDTFVIVADPGDPTIKICSEYPRTECYCLPEKVNSKGATLGVQVRKMYAEGKRYDGYFILDADTVLFEDFVEKMHDVLAEGYDLVLGNRYNPHPSGNWINCGSELTFTYLNAFNSKCRSAHGKTIIVEGSPLLLGSSIIEDFWGGDFPLNSLTEDIELMYICMLHDFRTYYNEYAGAYDEQPHTYKQSCQQRMRWVKGRSDINRRYNKLIRKAKMSTNNGIYKYDTLCSLLGPAIILVDCGIFFLYSLITAIVLGVLGDSLWKDALEATFLSALGLYLIFCFWTEVGLLATREKVNLTFWQGVQAFFTVPFFLVAYVPIYLKAMVKKDVQWNAIDHDKEKRKF